MRTDPWTCISCGYEFDSTEHLFDESATPQRNDLNICLNCGQVYQMRKKWKPLSEEQVLKLPLSIRAEIATYRLAIKQVIRVDLAFDQMSKKRK